MSLIPINKKVIKLLHHKISTSTHRKTFMPLLSLDRRWCVLISRRQQYMPTVHTHVIMEGFCFTGVVTCLSSLWCCTIQVPEYTVDKTGHEACKNHTNNLWPCFQGEGNIITYHHQECRNPGGSPSVMFFSHRIYE